MSIDAGGLAQMTYNNFNNAGLGMPGAGFASRGKGSQLKRLSLASPPKVASISEMQESVPTPRTSRSHLLAGLRTAPKTPTGSVPASAPYNQTQHRGYNDQYRGYGNAVPQTATGASFGNASYGQYPMNSQQQVYSLPEQVLAPPTMQYSQDEQTDPNFLAQLMATELFLEERRKQLQRQLLSLTNQGLPVDDNASYGQQYVNSPMGHQMSYQQQQQLLAQQQQQAINAVNNIHVVYNPLTGQYHQYLMDPNLQSHLAGSPPPPTPSYTSSPPKTHTPTFRAEVTPPDEKVNPFSRTSSPPKKSPSPPADVTPLPPPSANAFRRGHHKKVSSLALNSSADVTDGPRSAITRPGFPQTPSTGSFGPGQSRAGEHPVRQPRGPPAIEELKAAPTTKYEGSKNFATRQRRHAVKNLVRAGIERRGVRSGSPGSMTPVSETEMSYDSDSARSGSLSGKPSIGSLRAAANGAIGSERKGLARNRSSVDNLCSTSSISSDEGVTIGGKLVEVKVEDPKPTTERRSMMPRLVLTSAEKRKSSMG